MKYYVFSKSYELASEPLQKDPIHIFYQFFKPNDPTRLHELQFCLQQHVANPYIDTIHLLNEKIYLPEELNKTSPKIKQVYIQKRLHYKDVFQYIRKEKIEGFCIFLNADIFLSHRSLENLPKTQLSNKRELFALLRYEYNRSRPNESFLFGPRFDSQDTWIVHSNMLFEGKYDAAFDFPFGKPGCDNKLIYLFHCLGYDLYNDPFQFVTYHVHIAKTRNYSSKDTMHQPWGMLIPPNIPIGSFPPALGISLVQLAPFSRNFSMIQFSDNSLLHSYISNKVASQSPFLIPRISGIENNVAVFLHLITLKGAHKELVQGIKRLIPAMKNNAGIHLPDEENVAAYSKHYLQAFDSCDCYGAWEQQGIYIQHIAQSHSYMMQKYGNTKTPFWAYAFDIFHYIFSNPWTLALRNKRILLVSPFEESLREKVPLRKNIYGVDLFPDCTFTFLKPPQTHASNPSRPFIQELRSFQEKIDNVWSDFDVALLSCGGYANPIGSYIYKKGKSAIYVGGVLQMYFGILGSRWEKERPDVLRLFINDHWSRPKESERPKQSSKIEGGCYW